MRTSSAPRAVSRLIIAAYTGTRLTSEMNDTGQFLRNVAKNWTFILPGIVNPERLGYFTEFIRRRTAQAPTQSKLTE